MRSRRSATSEFVGVATSVATWRRFDLVQGGGGRLELGVGWPPGWCWRLPVIRCLGRYFAGPRRDDHPTEGSGPI
jgi:hypothetical protein